MGELFKYYLLIKRAYRISKVHLLRNFSDLGPCVMRQIKALDTYVWYFERNFREILPVGPLGIQIFWIFTNQRPRSPTI